MKALEFEASLNPDSTLTVPQEVAVQLQPDQPVRVIVLVPEAEEDHDWSRMTAEQFLTGYVESDALYDELPAG